jgi:hypothetical protein
MVAAPSREPRSAGVGCGIERPVPRLRRFPGALLVLLPGALWPAAGIVGMAGCGDDGPTSGAGGAAASGSGGFGGIDASLLPYAPCAADAKVGWFEILLDDGFTSVDGEVNDAVQIGTVPAVLGSDGDCRLLSRVVTTCMPGCPGATEECSPDAVCVPLPRKRDVGTVSVRGLLVPLAMEPNDVTRGYTNPGVPMLPYPGFLPGADLRINTEGGDYAPFELRGWGITALVLSGDAIDVRRGQPVRLAWEAPSAPGPARVNVQLDINVHGSNKTRIECDFPDTGVAEIPAPLVDGLFERGLSGDPTLTAERRSATSVEIEPGCVEMFVSSRVSTPVQVEGIVSCRTSSECPSPQQCVPLERFCE